MIRCCHGNPLQAFERGRAKRDPPGAFARPQPSRHCRRPGPASTVSRELSRNAGGAGYDAPSAQRDYHRRRRRGRRKLAPRTPLWEPVAMDLCRGWSPEQIAGRRRAMHPDEPALRVSHETVYLALYALPRGGLRKSLLGQLRQGRKALRPRGRGADRRGGLRSVSPFFAKPDGTSQSPSGAKNWRQPCLRRPAPVLRPPRHRDSAALRLSPWLPH